LKVICIDFDATINSYKSGWTSESDIPDSPIDGAQDAIARLRRNFRVVVFSTRARTVEGKNAVRSWLAKNGIEVDGITAIKIPAFAYVDDRAINFNGNWTEAMRAIQNFETYQDVEARSRELEVHKDEIDGLFDKGNIEPVNMDLI